MLIIGDLNEIKQLDAKAMARLYGGQGSIMEAVRQGMAKAIEEAHPYEETSLLQEDNSANEVLSLGNIHVL